MKIFSACAFVVGTAVLSGTSFVHAAAAAVRSADDAAVTPRPLTLEAALGNDAGMGSGSGSGRKPFEQQATTDKADAQVSKKKNEECDTKRDDDNDHTVPNTLVTLYCVLLSLPYQRRNFVLGGWGAFVFYEAGVAEASIDGCVVVCSLFFVLLPSSFLLPFNFF